MKHLKAIGFLIAVIVLLSLLLHVGGCSQHESKESLTFNMSIDGRDVPVEWSSSVKGVQWLYFTKSKEIEHVTPFSSLCVGELEAVPDANSIEASGGLFGYMIKSVITKGL